MPKDDFINSLSKHWFLLVFIVGMAITWGRFETKLQAVEVRQDNMDSKLSLVESSVGDIKGDLREIKTTLQFIKERLQ